MEIEVNSEGGLVLKKVFNTVILETSEGNKLAIAMRDDTIEMQVVGTMRFFRAEMETGNIYEIRPEINKEMTLTRLIKQVPERNLAVRQFNALRDAVKRSQNVLADYLPPGGKNAEETLSELLGILDDQQLVKLTREL